MKQQPYPWLSLRHRFRELPGVLLSLAAGRHTRRRLVRIVNHRQAMKERLKGW